MFDPDLPAEAQPLFEAACGNPKCRKQGEQVLLCSTCDSLTYCSEDCRLDDLKFHTGACEMIKELKDELREVILQFRGQGLSLPRVMYNYF